MKYYPLTTNTLSNLDKQNAIKVIKSGNITRGKYNLKVDTLIVLLDRQEKGSKNISASEEIKKDFNIEVHSLISISDIIEFVARTKEFEKFKDSIINYKEKYGS